MTVHVSVEEAAAHLPDLVQQVLGGEEVVISVDGDDQAQVTLVSSLIDKQAPLKPRRPGIDEGQFVVPDNFNDPLPDEILRAFEGQ
ncbi:type II toxin-antitoxin system Phd/YefM family antitoxin [Acaryochloris marina]|uniref:Conserved domain protein n=1 Tax=Acaryochloris marina (strain MBIC 11017) TaxID=329726 RepID=B0C5S9_ACAM1|nr:hypothetical protein [Acaryochloris marina]ABW28800.1 conserved domain protein [Acaryochloris marina MBIC11017]BDM77785.1 hypothetical protein AM10699_06560 [Acaryochloris marina MBIC10699]